MLIAWEHVLAAAYALLWPTLRLSAQTQVNCKQLSEISWFVWVFWLVLCCVVWRLFTIGKYLNFDSLSRQEQLGAALPHELFQDWSLIWSIYMPVWPKLSSFVFTQQTKILLQTFGNFAVAKKFCITYRNWTACQCCLFTYMFQEVKPVKNVNLLTWQMTFITY